MQSDLNVLVTGADGFIAKHLINALQHLGNFHVLQTTRATSVAQQGDLVSRADLVYHLAGTNRPRDPAEYDTGNADLTRTLCLQLTAADRRPLIVLASSVQALLDNPYGLSKRNAELHLEHWVREQGGGAAIFRLKNIFGKWCRPNYNSVTATFCHHIARGLPIEISDPARQLELVYIDDVISAMVAIATELAADRQSYLGKVRHLELTRSFKITLGELAGKIQSFRRSRETFVQPSFAEDFTRFLYATYLSHLAPAEFSYPLLQRTDQRGSLAEFIKQSEFGQVFISRTGPGITRGNHYHNTKTEKFFVVQGQAVIRFRPIFGHDITEHRVSGQDFKVVDIPPGYTHSIENVGKDELVTLFWTSEIFDPALPDTFALPVLQPSASVSSPAPLARS